MQTNSTFERSQRRNTSGSLLNLWEEITDIEIKIFSLPRLRRIFTTDSGLLSFRIILWVLFESRMSNNSMFPTKCRKMIKFWGCRTC